MTTDGTNVLQTPQQKEFNFQEFKRIEVQLTVPRHELVSGILKGAG